MIRTPALLLTGFVLAGCAEFGGAVGDVRIGQMRELVADRPGWVVPAKPARRAAEIPNNVELAATVAVGSDVGMWVLCDWFQPGRVFISITSPHLARTHPAGTRVRFSLNDETAVAERIERASYLLGRAYNDAWLHELSQRSVNRLEAEGEPIALILDDLDGVIATVLDDCRQRWPARYRAPAAAS